MDGWIQIKKISEPVFNEYGEEISNKSSFGVSIPCKYHSATRNDIVDIGGGNFSQASYVITVRNMGVTGAHFRLLDSFENIICEKDSKSLERLEKIKRIKILI